MFTCINPNDEEVVRRHREMAWIAKINKALEEDRFELCYQRIIPIAPTADDTADHGEHYELLLRMRDDQGELIPPGLFLPAAERYKSRAQIRPLGRGVCSELAIRAQRSP